MKPKRVSVLGLMALVLSIAVFLGVMRLAMDLRVALVVNASAAILIVATLMARFAPSRRSRDWWFGFALFGWAYALLSSSKYGGDYLVTAKMTDPITYAIFKYLVPFQRDANYSDARHMANNEYYVKAFKIFHSLASIVIAYLGAWLVAVIAGGVRRRDSRKSFLATGSPSGSEGFPSHRPDFRG
jgi:hypothetical protein